MTVFAATYSASILDSIIIGCFSAIHLMAPPINRIAPPVIAFLWNDFPLSESEKLEIMKSAYLLSILSWYDLPSFLSRLFPPLSVPHPISVTFQLHLTSSTCLLLTSACLPPPLLQL